MGKDLLGFHPRSVFRADGLDPNSGIPLYPEDPGENNLTARVGPFILSDAYRLADVYGEDNTEPFREDALVLCDVFERLRPSGKYTGMPILYYRANRGGTTHNVNAADNPANIYDYRDNQRLVSLGLPGDPNAVHPLSDPRRFYMNTMSDKLPASSQPHRGDSFILISAGYDGLYGTADDVCNFQWKYRE